MTLTKAQIVEIIAEKNGFAKNKSIEIPVTGRMLSVLCRKLAVSKKQLCSEIYMS